MTNNTSKSIIFTIEEITIEVHTPEIEISREENNRQLAKYIYRLIEMSERMVQ